MRRARPTWAELGALAAAGALASCASDPGGYAGFRASGDGDTLKVSSEFPGMDPLPLAQEYCAKRGGQARLMEASPTRWRFHCTPRE